MQFTFSQTCYFHLLITRTTLVVYSTPKTKESLNIYKEKVTSFRQSILISDYR